MAKLVELSGSSPTNLLLMTQLAICCLSTSPWHILHTNSDQQSPKAPLGILFRPRSLSLEKCPKIQGGQLQESQSFGSVGCQTRSLVLHSSLVALSYFAGKRVNTRVYSFSYFASLNFPQRIHWPSGPRIYKTDSPAGNWWRKWAPFGHTKKASMNIKVTQLRFANPWRCSNLPVFAVPGIGSRVPIYFIPEMLCAQGTLIPLEKAKRSSQGSLGSRLVLKTTCFMWWSELNLLAALQLGEFKRTTRPVVKTLVVAT